MKRLISLVMILFFSPAVLGVEETTTPNDPEVRIPPGDFPAGDYVIVPVAGAININNGNVAGCSASGTGCTSGWEFPWGITGSLLNDDAGPATGSLGIVGIGTNGANANSWGPHPLFATPELALAEAASIPFTIPDMQRMDLQTKQLGLYPNAIGSVTINFLLASDLPAPVKVDASDYAFSKDDLLGFLPFDQDFSVEKYYEKMLLDHPSSTEANLAYIDMAKAIGEILGDTESVSKMTELEAGDSLKKYEDKVREFIATERGAALWAQRDKNGKPTVEFRRAARHYGEKELRAWRDKLDISTEMDDKLGLLNAKRLKEDNAQIEWALADGSQDDELDWGQPEYHLDIERPGSDIKDALDSQMLDNMTNSVESVMPELAKFVVN